MDGNGENNNVAARANNQAMFLLSLDKFIDSVIAIDRGASKEDIVANFRERFNRSLRASIDYQLKLAEGYDNESDNRLPQFHRNKDQIYTTTADGQSQP